MAEIAESERGFWERARDYVTDVRAEMRRVTWPGKQEIYGTTVMVILTTFFFGFFFWICDMVISRIVTRILGWLGHVA